MSNVAIDLTKTVKEIITTMKTAIDNLNSDVATNKTAIDNLKTQILEAVYPVGSVYVSITNSSNPADILGFGTWEALPAGYGLVAQGTATAEDGSTLTFTAGQKSGEFKHQLTVGELAKHNHSLNWHADAMGNPYTQAAGNGYKPRDEYSGYAGNDEYHNNIAPCIASYLWKRTS
jgi:hypothetical protein